MRRGIKRCKECKGMSWDKPLVYSKLGMNYVS